MADPVTIPKTRSSFPEYLDFAKLKALGIEHIEQLGSQLWTDYNLHDPGITILEVLCYALTDLGYRKNFDTKDLLARSSAQKGKEELTAFGLPKDDNFFTAAEILSCNPVTITDLRKLLLDIPGVRNAWFETAEKGEAPIYLNQKKKSLQYQKPAEAGDDMEVKIKGLYDVCVELEEVLETDACDRTFFTTGDTLKRVREVLCAHRNLCEDIRDVLVFGEEEIGICTDIELASDADPEEVLLELYKQLEEFLAPTLHYYSLREMLDRGKRVEEIFEGRPLTADSHGFIDTGELEKLEPRKKLYASDMIELIMDIPGVLAVHKFVFTNYVNDLPRTKGERWCLNLTPKHQAHLALEPPKTKIQFFKESLPFYPDVKVVKQRFLEEKAASLKAKLSPYELDLPIPEGTYRDLSDYATIQNDFPLTYGIGEEGIRGLRDRLRRAQAKQLKTYLLFFDQILANYLAQLARVRDLFSPRPDDHPLREGSGGDRTYFVQLLREVPGVEALIKNINACPEDEGYLPVPENYPAYLEHIAESLLTYQERRNRFLDHLLARFAESFSEYVLLMFKIEGQRKDLRTIIEDKANFLQDYPELSRDRGKAFNYCPVTEPAQSALDLIWDTDNVSGLEKRASRLLGFEEVGRRTLSRGTVISVSEGWRFQIAFEGTESGETVMLQSSQTYSSPEAAETAFDSFLELAADARNYRRLNYHGEDTAPRYSFLVVDAGYEAVAEMKSRFESEAGRDIAIQRLIGRIRLNGLDCDIRQAVECFFFHILEATGEDPLLVSEQGYRTEAGAREALQRAFRLGVDHDAYEQTTAATGEGFGFVLLDEETGEVLARHPFSYETEAERDDRLQALIYYLDDRPPRHEIEVVTPGSYGFEVEDGDGNLLFISVRDYETEGEARADFHLLQKLARFRVYYRMIDNQTGDRPFTFELIDRKGDLLAVHPVSYATDCERDLVVDSIIYCSTNDEVSAEIVEESDEFVYRLQDQEGKVLMQSIDTFPDEEAAEAAWSVFMEVAGAEQSYQLTELTGEEKPFSFELLDSEGTAIARHPDFYALEAERDAALRAVVNLVCHTIFLVDINGDPGAYHHVLLGEADRLLLRSVNSYPGREPARTAFRDFLPFGRQVDYFLETTGDGFAVTDDSGAPLAENTDMYPSDNAREATIEMIVAYLREDPVQSAVVNEEGAYRAKVFDQNGRLALVGTEIFYEREAGWRFLGQGEPLTGEPNLLQYAARPENYQPHADSSGDCKYSFRLLGATGEIVAEHPWSYPDPETRNRAMADLFAYLTSGPYLEDDSLHFNDYYRFELQAADGRSLLQSTRAYPTHSEAELAFEDFLEKAALFEWYDLVEGTSTGQWTFVLTDPEHSGENLAFHPREYATSAEAEAVMMETFRQVKLGGLPVRIDPETGGYHFAVLDESGVDLLVGHDTYSTEEEVWNALLAVAASAADREAFFLTGDDTGEAFGFFLPGDETGAILATHPIEYSTESERDEALDSLLTYVAELELEPGYVPTPGTYFFEIRDFTGRLLLKSDQLFHTETSARSHFRNILLPAAVEEENYRLGYDNRDCSYTIELFDGPGGHQRIARYPGAFPSRRERDETFQYLLFLLRQHAIDARLEGTDCGFYFFLAGGGAELRSRRRFPDEHTALSACNALSEYPRGTGTCRVWERAEGYHFGFTGTGDEIAIESVTPYEDPEAAEAACGAFLQQLEEAPSILPELDYLPRGYACLLADGDAVWLESAGRATYEVHLTWPRVYDSPAERDAAIQQAIEWLRPGEFEPSFESAADPWMHYALTLGETGTTGEALHLVSRNVFEQEAEAREAFERMLADADDAINYRPLDDWDAGAFGFEIISAAGEARAHEAACEDCKRLLEAGQDPDHYLLISNRDDCFYGFELIDGGGDRMAVHPRSYATAADRDEAIKELRAWINIEGMHLVEHLLLRPLHEGAREGFFFELKDGDTVLFKSVYPYDSRDDALIDFRKAIQRFIDADPASGDSIAAGFHIYPFSEVQSTGMEHFYTYEILNEHGETIAEAGRCFSGPEGAVADIEAVKTFLESPRFPVATGEEETGVTEVETGVTGLPPFYQDDDAIDAGVRPIERSPGKMEGDELLAPVADCEEEANEVLCPVGSDPYSFRATVVLPYWPERFRRHEFRTFIDRTLRREAPAHVYLRICWIDSCQMEVFEQAYRRWLESLALGRDSCDAVGAQNELTRILFKLRNVYPEARLSKCDEVSAEDNPVILNQTVLGNANFSSDDNG